MTHEVTRAPTLSQEKKKEYFRPPPKRITPSPPSAVRMANIFGPELVDDSMLHFQRAPWYKQDMQSLGSRVGYMSATRSVGSQVPSEAPNSKSYIPETSLPRDATFNIAQRRLFKGFSPSKNSKAPERMNADLILILLKLSIQLRDNMVKIFAYVLYSSSFRLSLDLQESLREIYRATKSKVINICDIVFYVHDLLFLDPQAQFIRIFEWLDSYGPRYIIGEIKLWLNALKTKKVRIASGIRIENDVVTIDFLENMRENISRLKQNEIRLFHATSLGFHKTIKRSQFLEYIMESMKKGYLNVTLPLIGSILVHLHLDSDTPEVEEAVRYLTDVMYQNKSGMRFAVESIKVHDMKDPYTLANAVLTKLEDKYESYTLVSESVAMILPHLSPPNFFVSNRNHEIMSEILKLGEINFSLLLREISPNEYPEDIIQSKNLLLHAISNEEVNMKQFFKDFIAHEYTTPRDLLVAAVDRIKRRVKLPQHLMDHINSLSSHLKVKDDAIKMRTRKYQGLFYIIHLFDAFKSPYLPLYVRKGATDVLQALKNTSVNWNSVLEQFSLKEQSRPRAMVVKLLQSFLYNGFCKGRHAFLKSKIISFLNVLNSDGEPTKCHPKGCRLPSVITKVRSFVTSRDGNIIIDDKKSIHEINITDLMSDLDRRSGEDSNYSIFREFLFSHELSEIIEPFDPSLFLTTTDLLKNLTRRSLKSRLVQNDPILNNSITGYMQNLEQNMYSSKLISWLKPEAKTIDMGDIFKTVEKMILHQGEHVKHLHRVAEFLARDITPKELIHFDFQCLYTKEDFLRELLDYVSALPTLSEDIKEDITVVKQYILYDNKSIESLEFSKFC